MGYNLNKLFGKKDSDMKDDRGKLFVNIFSSVIILISTILSMTSKNVILFDILYIPYEHLTFWTLLFVIGGLFIFIPNIYDFFKGIDYKKIETKTIEFSILGSLLIIIGGIMRFYIPFFTDLTNMIPIIPSLGILLSFLIGIIVFVNNIYYKI
ncbi:MAG: hypothetical protein ACOCP8_02650 [archaeon]